MIVMRFFAYTLVECTVYVRGGAICARQLNPSMPPCHAWREKDGGIVKVEVEVWTGSC